MIKLRPAVTRGNRRASWINSYRTFSFPNYFDARYLRYSDLQTINDDRVQPGGHVPEHEHKNMEIFGYVVEGVCHHTDSQGHVFDLRAGSVQRMSCGSGIRHTEGNASDKPNRYLQLWVRPHSLDTEPKHEWHHFSREDKLNRFCDITEKLPIHQDARLLAGIFDRDASFPLQTTRRYYAYVVLGKGRINNIPVAEGDGLSFEQEQHLLITQPAELEVIVFDLR